MLSLNLNDTYVYDGTEIKLTGRQATNSRQKSNTKTHPELTLVEIKPLDKDLTWTKWVKQSELYVIQNITDEKVLMENK